jgi:hypothetical protein
MEGNTIFAELPKNCRGAQNRQHRGKWVKTDIQHSGSHSTQTWDYTCRLCGMAVSLKLDLYNPAPIRQEETQ